MKLIVENWKRFIKEQEEGEMIEFFNDKYRNRMLNDIVSQIPLDKLESEEILHNFIVGENQKDDGYVTNLLFDLAEEGTGAEEVAELVFPKKDEIISKGLYNKGNLK